MEDGILKKIKNFIIKCFFDFLEYAKNDFN